MRLIDADKIFPWYLKAFSADEIGEERAISPEEIRFSMNDIRENLENVPTEHPHKWIPVSERLPDTDDEVLCWYEYYHWNKGKVLPEYGIGRYLKGPSSWFGEVASGKDVRVIAWQPLPESYKPESEE